jgi:hypothetical protein
LRLFAGVVLPYRCHLAFDFDGHEGFAMLDRDPDAVPVADGLDVTPGQDLAAESSPMASRALRLLSKGATEVAPFMLIRGRESMRSRAMRVVIRTLARIAVRMEVA